MLACKFIFAKKKKEDSSKKFLHENLSLYKLEAPFIIVFKITLL
jgi:hypothetical protein